MSVLQGESYRGIAGSAFEISFSAGTVQDSTQSGSLPNSEPGTYPIVFSTLASGHMPTVTPTPISMMYTAVVIFSIQYTGTTASKQFDWKIKVNGDTELTYSAAPYWLANYYYTQVGYINGVEIGDDITVAAWIDATASATYQTKSLIIHPTRIKLWEPGGTP